MKDSEILGQIKRRREANVQRIRSELGELLDAADLLHHYANQWHAHVYGHRPIPEDLMEDPIACRETVLQVMAKESIITSKELCRVLEVGVFRATQWLFRKQFETRTNALFISLDETGESAQIYQNLQLIDQAKLNPEDEKFQGMRQSSVQFLRSKEIDIRDWNARNAWTKAANGKLYADLVSRFKYTAGQLKDQWTDELIRHEIELYRKSNTTVHPSLVGPANLVDYRFILASNFASLMTALNQYRQTAMWGASLAPLGMQRKFGSNSVVRTMTYRLLSSARCELYARLWLHTLLL